MGKGLLIQLPGVFTVNPGDPVLPKFYPNDSLLNEGSLFLFDAANPAGYPSQAANLVNGTTLFNLFTTSPNATLNGTAVYSPTTGGLVLGSNSNIQLGNNYNLATLNNPGFLAIIWIKQLVAASAFTALLRRGTTTTTGNMQYLIDLGADGQSPRGYIGGASTSATISLGAHSLNAVHQLAIARQGNTVYGFRNGVQVYSGGFGDTYANPNVTQVTIGAGTMAGASIFRTYMENLNVSGKTSLAQVQADYVSNVGRFS
ncbi:hypothetical protein GCM10028806_28620 [Spirosoma terrae]|uniref:LamG domain-containing protein n=1 Tax=Spirosoma terrae TaxID=1968276 RepID=A0A6L9LC86_9BACT|nr:hypothetical protein [Spirosoma terrae]NDU97177.1 hypothetical protein [Spirosoma terrae]